MRRVHVAEERRVTEAPERNRNRRSQGGGKHIRFGPYLAPYELNFSTNIRNYDLLSEPKSVRNLITLYAMKFDVKFYRHTVQGDNRNYCRKTSSVRTKLLRVCVMPPACRRISQVKLFGSPAMKKTGRVLARSVLYNRQSLFQSAQNRILRTMQIYLALRFKASKLFVSECLL